MAQELAGSTPERPWLALRRQKSLRHPKRIKNPKEKRMRNMFHSKIYSNIPWFFTKGHRVFGGFWSINNGIQRSGLIHLLASRKDTAQKIPGSDGWWPNWNPDIMGCNNISEMVSTYYIMIYIETTFSLYIYIYFFPHGTEKRKLRPSVHSVKRSYFA